MMPKLPRWGGGTTSPLSIVEVEMIDEYNLTVIFLTDRLKKIPIIICAPLKKSASRFCQVEARNTEWF